MLALVLALAQRVAWAQGLIEVTSAGGAVLLVAAAVLVFVRGYRPALWYLGGQSMLFLAVLVVVLVNWGLVDSPFLNANGLQLGIVMEMLVFAMAMSRRIRLIQAEQTALQRQAGWLAKAAQTDALTGLANRARAAGPCCPAARSVGFVRRDAARPGRFQGGQRPPWARGG